MDDSSDEEDGNDGKKGPLRRFVFKPSGFELTRAELVHNAFSERRQTQTADEPTLVEHFLDYDRVQRFILLMREECPIPGDCAALVNAVLNWEGTGYRSDHQMVLLRGEEIDKPGGVPVIAGITCSIVLKHEARRNYNERLHFLPIGAATASGVSIGNEPLVNNRKGAPPNELALAIAKLNLAPDKKARLGTLRAALPNAADSAYVALESGDPIACEQLLTDAERSAIDELTRWRMSVIQTQSFHVSMRLYGYVRRDFVRLCCPTTSVRGKKYYFVNNTLFVNRPEVAIRPVPELIEFDTRQHQAPQFYAPRPVRQPSPELTLGNDDDDGPALNLRSDSPPLQVRSEPLPPTPVVVEVRRPAIANTYREPHLLDLLRTVLHMDATGEDKVDIEELEFTANHRLRVLGTMAALALADPNVTLAQLEKSGQVSVEDREVVAQYPRGYLAPRRVKYEGAPGLRSIATYDAYAALGLGVLCVAVRNEPQLIEWLQYTEALFANRQQRATEREIREHLDGVVEFIKNTEEPDPESEPLVAELVKALRFKLSKYKVERVHQQIVNDMDDIEAEELESSEDLII
jgi:hypothetical protein